MSRIFGMESNSMTSDRALVAALSLILTTAQAVAQPFPGDPKAGLEFARKHCADCHYVESVWSGYSPVGAPAFTDVAALPEWTALSFRVFLQSPHEYMPDFILTEREADDVISYLLSLKNMRLE